MRIIEFITLALIIIVIVRHRSTARAIKRAADRSTWAQASDTRYARYPRRTMFGTKKGMK